MNQKERQLLREEIGDAKPDFCLRSKARIDTGRWWRRSPLWLCVASGQLIMLSVGRRQYSARLPISSCARATITMPRENLSLFRAKALNSGNFHFHHAKLSNCFGT